MRIVPERVWSPGNGTVPLSVAPNQDENRGPASRLLGEPDRCGRKSDHPQPAVKLLNCAANGGRLRGRCG